MAAQFFDNQILAAVAWSSERIDLLCLNNPTGVLWHNSWDQYIEKWQAAWDSLAGNPGTLGRSFLTGSTPAIVSRATGTLDVFGVDSGTSALLAKSYEGSQWQDGWSAAGGLTAEGSVSADTGNRAGGPAGFYCRDSQYSALYYAQWDDSSWLSDPQSHGGILTTDVAVTSWGADRADIFGVGTDQRMYHLAYDGGAGWQNGRGPLGGQWNSTPAAVSWSAGRIDVFARGLNTSLQHQYWNGSSWHETWESLGGALNSPLSAVSRGSGQLDIFALGTDLALWHLSFDENDDGWSGWYSLEGGPFSTPPVALDRGSDLLEIFVVLATAMFGIWGGKAHRGRAGKILAVQLPRTPPVNPLVQRSQGHR